MKPIFIIGEQRSGSNLLRLMLSQAGIAAPHPPHLLTRMLDLIPSYGDLSRDSLWSRLVEDACVLVERNPVPWTPLSGFDRDDISARCRERSLYAIFGALMDTYAEALGTSSWACKSMQYCRYGQALDDYFGDPKYIYLYRDGRDVTLSFTKAVIGEKHPYFIASQWHELQQICLAERERVGQSRFFSLCYEELIAEPEPILRSLCEFLDVEFTASMLSFHASGEAKSTSAKSQLWENLGRPVMRDNSRKYMKELSRGDISIIESVAGDSLDALGYERVAIERGHENVFSAEMVEGFSSENDKKKQALASMMDDEDAERRDHQVRLLIERVYFLTELSRQESLRFLAFVEEEHYERGALIVEQGERSRALYFLIEGEVSIEAGDERDEKHPPKRLTHGEAFGEIAALTGQPRSKTVRAVEQTRVFRLSWESWNMMRRDAPEIAASVLWAISARLAERFRQATS